jgi:NAD(P)H-dependent FMN reductase
MKLAIINGSPRNKKSNSTLLINQFLEGFNSKNTQEVPIHYLANQLFKKEGVDTFIKSDVVIIIFPLYTDCMPAIVKEYFERLFEVDKVEIKSKKIGFIVQSGFPEVIHSVAVEHYLEKLTKRLQCEYLGTVIKGSVEGIQVMPPFMTRKLFKQFKKLGEYFAENTAFSPEIMKILRNPYKMSPRKIAIFKLLIKLGFTNFYWNSNLKKNGTFEKRFDKPYQA